MTTPNDNFSRLVEEARASLGQLQEWQEANLQVFSGDAKATVASRVEAIEQSIPAACVTTPSDARAIKEAALNSAIAEYRLSKALKPSRLLLHPLDAFLKARKCSHFQKRITHYQQFTARQAQWRSEEAERMEKLVKAGLATPKSQSPAGDDESLTANY